MGVVAVTDVVRCHNANKLDKIDFNFRTTTFFTKRRKFVQSETFCEMFKDFCYFVSSLKVLPFIQNSKKLFNLDTFQTLAWDRFFQPKQPPPGSDLIIFDPVF